MSEQEKKQQATEVVNGMLTIKATGKPEGAEERVEGSIDFEVGNNVNEAVEKFGEELIFEFFKRALIVKAQAAIRREIENGTHPNDLQQVLGTWDPAQTHTVRRDPKSSILKDFSALSEEERMEILNALREQG